MTTTMLRSVMLTVLAHIFLTSRGVWCLERDGGTSFLSGAVNLPWQDELCCDSSSVDLPVEEDDSHAAQANLSQSNQSTYRRCSFRSLTAGSHHRELSGGTCLDILCRLDENWENLTCDLQSSVALDTGPLAISLQRVQSNEENIEPNNGDSPPDNPVVCEAEDSFMCSVTLDTTKSFVTVVTVSISGAVAPPVQLRIPALPVKPNPPINLSHIQTIKAELILRWQDPPDSGTGPLRYEVRYSSNTSHPDWQVACETGEPRSSLDLKPRLNYTIQVRCSSLGDPPAWSDWSEPHHIYLDTVTYIPEKVVARPGEDVTVYCVFNDHNVNASMAMWMLNFKQQLNRSQYHPVHQWVSQITMRPSETRMYDLLQCTREWSIPYSQIFVEGASIDINCETNGDIDAMDCSWKNTQLTKLEFRSRWADLPCDVMEERDKLGEEVGEMGPTCLQKSCTIQPLRMNCYKLWLEVPYHLGPIRSKPIYLSPIDHVKPHTPMNVKAVSRSTGVLTVTWEPPSLPVEGLQCRFRYHSPSASRALPEWKVQNPVQIPRAEVAVPNMCRVYVVQVQCKQTNSTGHWSEWSDSVYSTPQNSRAPEHGPDFWRILHDDPQRNQTNVTLLFEHLHVSGRSYCVDGLVVRRWDSSGSVTREEMDVTSSYSFEWNQMPQTVSVEAFNNVGSSTKNINMTLDKQPKRRCVRSFTVSVINSTFVSLSWTLLDNSSVPLYMVVQWSPQRHQDPDLHKDPGRNTWARLPYTDRPTYLRGDFFGSEDCGFYLYPVFADGEGEPMFSTGTRGDPAAYMMLMIISFLSIVLFVTLVLSQNQMKKFMWKDVPNPNKCSWAKGLDLKKADTIDHPFRPPEGLPAWPLLLPDENISKVVIVDKVDLSVLTTALFPGSEVDQPHLETLTNSSLGINRLLLDDPPADPPPCSSESSAQSSVTYTTVLLSDPKQEPRPLHLHYKDGSGSSSSDEGNFSANNSDISGSFPCGLWDPDDPRRSCSYNSVEELSETSEQEDEGAREEKDLYYLGMDYPAEDGESGEDEQPEADTQTELLKKTVLNREDCSVESHPLLRPQDSSELLSASPPGFSLYLPQYRTAQCTRHPTAQTQDVQAQL
ncbi:leptin receptor isoform X2 [Antennarius striatus]|uniref:leptin receptor isoform X2 n=1 Tax=Antennarius striatus TaxID=241820 RepID=UPI0035B1F3E9